MIAVYIIFGFILLMEIPATTKDAVGTKPLVKRIHEEKEDNV